MSAWSHKNKKNVNFVIFINRKYLKAISSVKTKKKKKTMLRNHFLSSFWIYIYIYTGLGYFIRTTHTKGSKRLMVRWAKNSQFHWINLSHGNECILKNYSYLNPIVKWTVTLITGLVLLCCSVYHYGLEIDCDSITQ